VSDVVVVLYQFPNASCRWCTDEAVVAEIHVAHCAVSAQGLAKCQKTTTATAMLQVFAKAIVF
jgi:peroxiredoxin